MRILALALLLAATPAAAQIYKWIDGKGKVQYGEKPPPGAKLQPMRGEAAPAPQSGTPPPAEDLSQKEQEFRERQVRQRMEEERAAQQAEVKRINCESARAQVENTVRSNLYRRQGAEKVYLSDQEREAELKRLRALVAKYCR